jgi:hypothetical protein
MLTGLCLIATAGGADFLDGLFDRFPGLAGAFLNPAQQFILPAVNVLQIVIRELGPLLFQLALGDVPVALDFECVHIGSLCFLFLFAAKVTAKNYSFLVRQGCAKGARCPRCDGSAVSEAIAPQPQ